MSCDKIRTCSDVCNCLLIESPDGTILIEKLSPSGNCNEGDCKFNIRVNTEMINIDETLTSLVFNPTTRILTYTDEQSVAHDIQLPNDLQTISLTGNILTLNQGGGSVDLGALVNSLQVTFAATSNSLIITPGGSFGHTPNFEVKISTDPCNPIIQGTDGGIYFSMPIFLDCLGCDPCTPAPVANFEFNWDRLANDSVDLTFIPSPQFGINGTFSQIDWGDGTINTSLSHTYTLSGNYKVTIYDSTATVAELDNLQVTSITKIPSTLTSALFINNLITNYPVFNSTSLLGVDFSQNQITNLPNFTGTPNLLSISFSNNNISGSLDTSMLNSLISLRFNENNLTSISSLVNHPSLNYVNFSGNPITVIPDFTSCPNLTIILFNNTDISGTLDVTQNLDLQVVEFENAALSSMPDLSNNTLLSAFNFNNCNLSGTLDITNNTQLLSMAISTNAITNITGYSLTTLRSGNFSSNNLSVALINNLLTHIDSQGVNNFNVMMQGQTPSAPPSGAGITAVANLISRGYTVTTD